MYISSLTNTAAEIQTISSMWDVCVLHTRNQCFHAHTVRNNTTNILQQGRKPISLICGDKSNGKVIIILLFGPLRSCKF